MRKQKYEQKLKEKKRGIKSAPCSLQSRSDSGTEADTYAKTYLCMEIAKLRAVLLPFQAQTHSSPREDLLAEEVLLCKTLIPLQRLILTSRVSSNDSGIPAASGTAKHQGCGL